MALCSPLLQARRAVPSGAAVQTTTKGSPPAPDSNGSSSPLPPVLPRVCFPCHRDMAPCASPSALALSASTRVRIRHYPVYSSSFCAVQLVDLPCCSCRCRSAATRQRWRCGRGRRRVCRARPAPSSARPPRALGRAPCCPSSRRPAPAAPAAGRGRCSGLAHVCTFSFLPSFSSSILLIRIICLSFLAEIELFASNDSDDDVSDCQLCLHPGHGRRPPLLHPHGRRPQRRHRKSSSSFTA